MRVLQVTQNNRLIKKATQRILYEHQDINSFPTRTIPLQSSLDSKRPPTPCVRNERNKCIVALNLYLTEFQVYKGCLLEKSSE